LQRWSADALRLYLSWHHYRRPWSHDLDVLAQADRLAAKLRTAVTLTGGSGNSLDGTGAEAGFTAALNDDLNTPEALSRLEGLTDAILAAAQSGHDVGAAQAVLRRLAEVLGLVLDRTEVEARVIEGWRAHLARFTVTTATR